MAIQVVISAVDRSAKIQQRRVRYSLALGSDWTATFVVFDTDSTAAAYRPALDAPVLIKNATVTTFKGKIVTVRDRPIVSPKTGVATEVTVRGQIELTDQIEVTATYAAGFTLKQIVVDLALDFLTAVGLGTCVDSGMASGPTMGALTFDHVSFAEAMNYLATITGWVWRLTPGDVLEVFEVGTKTAAFSLTAANGKAVGPVPWEQTALISVNSATLLYGGATQLNQTFTATGTGAISSWVLDYTPVLNASGVIVSRGLVTEGGVEKTLGGNYTYTASSNTLTRAAGNLGNGVVITFVYTVQYPQEITVEDATDIAARGLWAKTYTKDDIFTLAEATNYVNGKLRQNLTPPKRVTVVTREGLELPGTVITLTFTDRVISGAYLIMNTSAETLIDGAWQYTYTCLSGEETQQSWTEALRSALGRGATNSGGNVSGSVIPNLSGHYAGNVIAHTGEAQKEVISGDIASILNYLGGPGIWMNQNPNTGAGRGSWAVVTDQTSGDKALLFQDRAVTGLGTYTIRLVYQAADDYALHALSGVALRLGLSGSRIEQIETKACHALNGYTEHGRTVALGERIAVSYTAGDFTASAGTWTVDSVDLLAFSYTLAGKLMTVFFEIASTDVSASPASLNIRIPGGFTSAAFTTRTPILVQDAGTAGVGWAYVGSSVTAIELHADMAGTAWTTTAADNTGVQGQISLFIA